MLGIGETGKFKNRLSFLAARTHRSWRRRQVASLVSWRPPDPSALRPGCSALIGMCHLLPNVLLANLSCLARNAWPTLEDVIVVVDSERGCLPDGFEARARAAAGRLRLKMHYYSAEQDRRANRIRLPYVYSWLSWSIALSLCQTRTALLHDYDAIILDGALGERHDVFLGSGAKVQGIRWYRGNGILPEDRLATTFEAFLDVAWLRRFPPVMMFNQIGRVGGRTADFDTLLDLQANHLAADERAVVPMGPESLVHPSQMVHQFTMVRRMPRAPQPVYSLPMIPFFEWLGGDADALARASDRIDRANGKVVPFFDGIDVNFATLQPRQVSWCLKQMLQVCEATGQDAGLALYDYGRRLYRLAGADGADVWSGDFTASQTRWIAAAAATAR